MGGTPPPCHHKYSHTSNSATRNNRKYLNSLSLSLSLPMSEQKQLRVAHLAVIYKHATLEQLATIDDAAVEIQNENVKLRVAQLLEREREIEERAAALREERRVALERAAERQRRAEERRVKLEERKRAKEAMLVELTEREARVRAELFDLEERKRAKEAEPIEVDSDDESPAPVQESPVVAPVQEVSGAQPVQAPVAQQAPAPAPVVLTPGGTPTTFPTLPEDISPAKKATADADEPAEPWNAQVETGEHDDFDDEIATFAEAAAAAAEDPAAAALAAAAAARTAVSEAESESMSDDDDESASDDDDETGADVATSSSSDTLSSPPPPPPARARAPTSGQKRAASAGAARSRSKRSKREPAGPIGMTEINKSACVEMRLAAMCGETNGSSGEAINVRATDRVLDYSPLFQHVVRQGLPYLQAKWPEKFGPLVAALPRADKRHVDINRRDNMKGRAGAKPVCVVCDEEIPDGHLQNYYTMPSKEKGKMEKRHVICAAIECCLPPGVCERPKKEKSKKSE